jgi:hypothetical protein
MAEPLLRFHDPRAVPGAPQEPYTLALDDWDGATIGLLANGFPDSDRFLDRVGDALAKAAPGLRLERYDKRDASSLASESLLAKISAACRAVVTAYGH